MTDDPIDLDGFANSLSLDAPGPGDYERMMKALTLVVELVADDLPPLGLTALAAARRRWLGPETADTPLLEHRIACWKYLDAKHGNSTTIADREDHALRAVIAVLFEAAQGDLYEGASFTLEWWPPSVSEDRKSSPSSTASRCGIRSLWNEQQGGVPMTPADAERLAMHVRDATSREGQLSAEGDGSPLTYASAGSWH